MSATLAHIWGTRYCCWRSFARNLGHPATDDPKRAQILRQIEALNIACNAED